MHDHYQKARIKQNKNMADSKYMMSKHNAISVIPFLTKKLFSNTRRIGKDFSGRDTPLFPIMLVPTQEEELAEDEAVNEEMYDILERATATATILDAEQDRETIEKISQIKDRLKATRDRQKSYADKRMKALEFSVGILDREFKKLKRSIISIVKILYRIDGGKFVENYGDLWFIVINNPFGKGEGHMARLCLKPKRKRDTTWFREKALLVKAQGNGKVLNKEELEFLADPGITEGPVTHSVITYNAAYQADDLDAYDFDCDKISTAKAVLMANLSSYRSNVLSEVPISNNNNNDMLNQSVQDMPYSEPSHLVQHLENEIHSDSNIIPHSQYLIET
nr:reverse transcriptase domain-containing protein [Tanacetum cinerariifolium]